MKNIPKYDDRIVAFLDILGFEHLVNTLNENPELHSRIYAALSRLKQSRDISLQKNTSLSDLEVNIFSDSIVVSTEPNFDSFFGVIWCCGWLQAQLLFMGVLIRGGISIGPTIHEKDLIYGKGLIKSYEIEKKASIYPRIVVDPELFNHVKCENKNIFLAEDTDGLWFIDPFQFEAFAPIPSRAIADGYDPREIYFIELEKHIVEGINESKTLAHKAKWTWLLGRHKMAFSQYKKGEKTMMRSLFDLTGEIPTTDHG